MTIDLDRVAGDPTDEAGRILRYWGGNLKYVDLTNDGEQHELSDSRYTVVGMLRVEG